MLLFLEMRRFGGWNLYWVRLAERTLPTCWENYLNGNFNLTRFYFIRLPTCWENYLNGNTIGQYWTQIALTSHLLGKLLEWKPNYLFRRSNRLVNYLPTRWENYLNGNLTGRSSRTGPKTAFPLAGKLTWMETGVYSFYMEYRVHPISYLRWKSLMMPSFLMLS